MECVALNDEWGLEAGVAHSAPAGFLYPGCRRAASFPFFGDKDLVPASALKVRSQSESEGLNRIRNVMTIEQFKMKLRLVPETREEESGCDTETDNDSTLSQSGSSTADLADLATETDEISLTEAKKRVRFADDCGKDLFCVKVMSEPSDCPPVISPAVLRRFRGDDWDEESHIAGEASTWTLSFSQPASEYVKFREKIEAQKVSLENIVLRNDQHHMTGTIKVANIAFEKRVFIRWTSNGWKSYLDKPASFQVLGSSRVYDTFTFDVEIPRDTTPDARIEFCVCYVAGDHEYWDSRDGNNYIIESQSKVHTPTTPALINSHAPLFGSFKDRDDAYKQNYDNWSGFASWRNLSVEGPYW